MSPDSTSPPSSGVRTGGSGQQVHVARVVGVYQYISPSPIELGDRIPRAVPVRFRHDALHAEPTVNASLRARVLEEHIWFRLKERQLLEEPARPRV